MKKGFTLVELLIVIIIIGILATMAIPQYNKMVGRARWVECVTLVGQIKTAESLYYAENGGWTADSSTVQATGPLSSYIDTAQFTANTKFSFSIKTKGLIYGASRSKQAADDYTGTGLASSIPYYAYDLTSNTTSYGNGAPDSM